MRYEGRDGAFEMTFNRVVTDPVSLPANLLSEAKTALFITDESFNDKISLLCFDAIYDFERLTSTSVLPQVINLHYEYFFGKNKLPFAPNDIITAINGISTEEGQEPLPDGYTYSNGYLNTPLSIYSNVYLTSTISDPVTITYRAGSTTVPANIRRTLVKMVENMFRTEDYSQALKSEIRSYSQWMD